MESMYLLNGMLNPEIIREASIETGIEPAFIEKDWYAVQLLKRVSEFTSDVDIIFSGGTSLSKGFGIIKRFSEDLDFIIAPHDSLSVGQRRGFRKSVLADISADNSFGVDDARLTRGDSHRFFKAPILYKMNFEQNFLRPYLQLEMTFADNMLPAIEKDISSIIGELSGDVPETKIKCISPIETAANKISALTWRVVVRERNSDNDDPTVIRHLHDLSALSDYIAEHEQDFIKCAKQSLLQDQQSRGGEQISSMSVHDRLQKALELLNGDAMYRTEYDGFVKSVSYAQEDEEILFDDALRSLEELISRVS